MTEDQSAPFARIEVEEAFAHWWKVGCVDEDWDALPATASDKEVAGALAAYDVVALPVVDDAGRLVGAVTIDDVLDQVLPDNWRLARSESE